MIRRVRRQFIAITMAMLTTVLMVPLVALNTITAAMSYNQTRNLLVIPWMFPSMKTVYSRTMMAQGTTAGLMKTVIITAIFCAMPQTRPKLPVFRQSRGITVM